MSANVSLANAPLRTLARGALFFEGYKVPAIFFCKYFIYFVSIMSIKYFPPFCLLHTKVNYAFLMMELDREVDKSLSKFYEYNMKLIAPQTHS